jgi:hypothetical protein
MGTLISPTAAALARSSGAERMRRHCERRRDGLRCVVVELRETEINELIRMGLFEIKPSVPSQAERWGPQFLFGWTAQELRR